MKILVTGATGFIGSHLVEKLVGGGQKVSAFVRNKEAETSKKEKKDSINLLKKLNVNFCYGDLSDEKSIEGAVQDVDVVFHLAAIARPMAIPWERYFEVNEKGTRNLLRACKKRNKKKKFKKIIIMSSVSAVGPTRNGSPVNENTKCLPVDTYGRSKLAGEKVAMDYFDKDKLPIVILRPPMVFGPRDFEMLRLFKTVKKGFFPVGSNEKCMEFLYVGNLVEACLLALENGRIGEKYHISNGEHYSINQIVNEIAKAEGKKVLPIHFPKSFFVLAGYFVELFGKIIGFKPPFKHDTVIWMTKKFWYSDISKARKELEYAPKFSLEEGIKKTVEYYTKKNFL